MEALLAVFFELWLTAASCNPYACVRMQVSQAGVPGPQTLNPPVFEKTSVETRFLRNMIHSHLWCKKGNHSEEQVQVTSCQKHSKWLITWTDIIGKFVWYGYESLPSINVGEGITITMPGKWTEKKSCLEGSVGERIKKGVRAKVYSSVVQYCFTCRCLPMLPRANSFQVNTSSS